MKRQRGFIALMSAVIISAVLLVLIVNGSLTGWYSRFNVLDAESKERSSALADACVDRMLLQLSGGTVSVDSSPYPIGSPEETCQILSDSSPYKIQAVVNNSYTNLLISADPATLTVTSWQEVGNLP